MSDRLSKLINMSESKRKVTGNDEEDPYEEQKGGDESTLAGSTVKKTGKFGVNPLLGESHMDDGAVQNFPDEDDHLQNNEQEILHEDQEDQEDQDD